MTPLSKKLIESELQAEVRGDLPADSSFNDPDKHKILAIYHLQGPVTAGFREGQGGVLTPYYADDLGGKLPDAGGQTMHVFEKLNKSAKIEKSDVAQEGDLQLGVPSLMFAMSNDWQHPDELKVVRHNLKALDDGDAFVVYLPFRLFEKAGIKKEEMFFYGNDAQNTTSPFAFIPKEVTMRHRERLYPLIAKASLDFMRTNIRGFNDKDVVLDGNYMDAGQTILEAQKMLKSDASYKGSSITVFTPHTLCCEKATSLLSSFLKNIDEKIDALGTGYQGESIQPLKHHPYLEKQRNVLQALEEAQDSVDVAKQIRHVVDTRAVDYADFEAQLKRRAHTSSADGIGDVLEEVIAHSKTSDLTAQSKKFSFIDRLTMEGAENLSRFDAIVSVGEDSIPRLEQWTKKTVPFARNGVDTNVFCPDALKNVAQDKIADTAAMLVGKAHSFKADGTRFTPYHLRAARNNLMQGTTFIAVSRPDFRKGSDLAIKAFAQWAKEHPEEQGSLVLGAHKPEPNADNSYALELIGMVKKLDADNPNLHLSERIFLLPSLERDEIRLLYGLPKSVGMAPSLNEPWGVVACEQASAGIPVIASDRYQSANYMRKNMQAHGESVVSFTSGDSAALAKRMDEVSTHYATYKKIAEENSIDIRQQMQWEKTTATYHEVYDKTMAAKSAALVNHTKGTPPHSYVDGVSASSQRMVQPRQDRSIATP